MKSKDKEEASSATNWTGSVFLDWGKGLGPQWAAVNVRPRVAVTGAACLFFNGGQSMIHEHDDAHDSEAWRFSPPHSFLQGCRLLEMGLWNNVPFEMKTPAQDNSLFTT